MAAASGETIEAVNTLKQGRVRVEKVDERKPEEKLAGAMFEVKNRETGEKVQMETDESGQAESPFLPIGTIGENGSWIPYHYEVRETMPPDGYQLIPRVYEVLIEDQKECEVLTYDLTVPNETTKIKISKLDFDTGLFVSGARLAVYEAGFLDGVYTEAGEALETWDLRWENTRDRRKADCRAHVSSERTGSAGWIHCAETDDFHGVRYRQGD